MKARREGTAPPHRRVMKSTLAIVASLIFFANVSVSAFPGAGKAAAPAAKTIKGKALEVIQAGSYTYLRIEQGKDSVWAAIPKSEVEKDKTVEIYAGMDMKNFKSKTLKRTFKTIVFSNGLAGGTVPSTMHGKSTQKAPVKVEKAKGPDARTVAEIFKMKKDLAGKPASVRGTVVKVSEGIMDRNWVHLQDGTGSAKNGDNDLLVTTQEVPENGSVVTFHGPVVVDQDFGSGYNYPVLMEKGVLVP